MAPRVTARLPTLKTRGNLTCDPPPPPPSLNKLATVIGGTAMLALIVALPLLAVAGASERTTVEPAAGTFHLAEAQAVGLDDASRPPTALAAVEAGNWAMSLDLDWLLQWPCQDCVECFTFGGSWGHRLVANPSPWNARVGWHKNCNPGSCFIHPWCQPDAMADGASRDPGEQDPWKTVEVIKNATPPELMALVAKYPEAVRINGDRRALQLIGCGETVVASYGVTSVPSLRALLQ